MSQNLKCNKRKTTTQGIRLILANRLVFFCLFLMIYSIVTNKIDVFDVIDVSLNKLSQKRTFFKCWNCLNRACLSVES